MHCCAIAVVSLSSFVVLFVVTATFHYVDLARRGPTTIIVVLRQHPNGGPQPFASGQLGSHLDTAVLEAERLPSGDLGRLNWINDLDAVRGTHASVKLMAGARVRRRGAPHVHGKSAAQIVLANFVGRRSGLDVKHSVFHVRVRPVIVVQLKLPVTTASHCSVVCPRVMIQRVELVGENQNLVWYFVFC